tara:strand:- start:518 stop:1315 length:798 start_codon:yes stop_codon:yes gene_type:complete
MHKNTPQIKKFINENFDDSYERVSYFKNKYEGETAYILGTGPSINDIPKKDFEKLKDKLVISMKQTLSSVPDADYHLLNFCNLTKYEYKNENTIVGWSVWDGNQPHTIINNFDNDFILPTYKLNDGSVDLENSIAFNLDQLDKLDIDSGMARPWGPGTMYEMAIPLAVYFGCNKIVTLGWDLYGTEIDRYKDDIESLTQPHCYNNEDLEWTNTDTSITRKEIVGVIKSTKMIKKWLNDKGVDLEIIDPNGNNPAYKSIKKREKLW